MSCSLANRALVDIIAAGNAALRLSGVEAFAGLFLLVRSEGRLTAEFDAVCFCVGPAARRAFENTAAFELRRNAKGWRRCPASAGGVTRQWPRHRRSLTARPNRSRWRFPHAPSYLENLLQKSLNLRSTASLIGSPIIRTTIGRVSITVVFLYCSWTRCDWAAKLHSPGLPARQSKFCTRIRREWAGMSTAGQPSGGGRPLSALAITASPNPRKRAVLSWFER